MSKSTELVAPAVQRGARANQASVSFFENPLQLRTILVPLDFSETSCRALEFALPLAKRFGAAVHVLYVYEGKPRPMSSLDRVDLFSDPSDELFSDDEIAGRLHGEVQRRFGVDLELKDCHYRTGKASTEICDVARKCDADLIVIATHGHTSLKHLILGSTAEKIVCHAACPVLVVREASRGPIKTAAEGIILEKILVPVDFSDCASQGARYASVFATKVGADLLLMHVVNPPDDIAAEKNIIGPPWPQVVQTALIEAEDKLETMMNFLPLIGISAETRVVAGEPIEKLEEETRRADVDMVITSTHGYTGLRHALLGSVAEELVRVANCPVLVVPSHCRRVDF